MDWKFTIDIEKTADSQASFNTNIDSTVQSRDKSTAARLASAFGKVLHAIAALGDTGSAIRGRDLIGAASQRALLVLTEQQRDQRRITGSTAASQSCQRHVRKENKSMDENANLEH